jgi:DNA-binding YbaB/EbfC family protein
MDLKSAKHKHKGRNAMAKAKAPQPFGKGMMAQIQRLQEQLEQTQSELAEEVIEASVGGGAVKISMSGAQECRSVVIAPHLLQEGDVEMLQDLVLLAINQAIHDSQAMAARRLGPLAGGMGLPGLGK